MLKQLQYKNQLGLGCSADELLLVYSLPKKKIILNVEETYSFDRWISNILIRDTSDPLISALSIAQEQFNICIVFRLKANQSLNFRNHLRVYSIGLIKVKSILWILVKVWTVRDPP